jgi:hypothetical protein
MEGKDLWVFMILLKSKKRTVITVTEKVLERLETAYQRLKLGDTQERIQAVALSCTAQLAVASTSVR